MTEPKLDFSDPLFPEGRAIVDPERATVVEPDKPVVRVPVDPSLAYAIQVSDDNWAVVLTTPANRLQRFLQLLVGIQWRPRT